MANARKELEELLTSLGESSRFVAAGSLAPALPGLTVKGAGAIGTPVSAADAKRLIAAAEQAPYGRGEKTILDTDVRRVWQLDPKKFALKNRAWDAHLAAIVDEVRKQLGIAQKVKAELYKLLVYEKGSFFAPHRDTEKTSRMFGTLVVCLPARHAGGALIVSHEGETETIGFGGKEGEFKTQYAAFYADCEHEIKPVTSGYRVCLVYNLATAGRKQPSPPQNLAAVHEAARLLPLVFADDKAEKIAVPFQHQYTQAGLDPQELKGSDRACADVLVRAAERLKFEIYFALLTHWQSGEPDYATLDYDPWHRRRSYGWYDDEGEEEDEDSGESSDAEMGEVFDESLTLDHWRDPQGGKPRFGEIGLEEDEILHTSEKKDWACRQEIEEASGNAGVSMERWYRQGVIVIWPSDRKFRVLAGEGQQAALPELEKMAARAKRPDALAACRAFAAAIVASWQPGLPATDGAKGYSGRMLAVLDRIAETDLALRFVEEILPKDYDGSEGPALLRLAARAGWPRVASLLSKLIAAQRADDHRPRLAGLVNMCRPLCCDQPPMTTERRAARADVAAALVEAFERWDAKKTISCYGPHDERKGVVADMLMIFAANAAGDRMEWLAEHVIADAAHYDLRQVLISEVAAIYEWLPQFPDAKPAAARLLGHCWNELRTATAEPVTPPEDWAREAALGCKCPDCAALAKFLRDPAARVGRFPLAKQRRQHLHNVIDGKQIDCTHITERKGSPQTLVCTKTQASYQRRLKQFESDVAALAKLEALAGGTKRKSRSARTVAKARVKKK